MMKINEFTVPELEKFRMLCNFDEDELQYFNLRAKHKSNTYISLEMHMSSSKISKLSKSVKAKIIKVL